MPPSSVLTACWPWSRVSGGCGKRGPVAVREVGRSVCRRSGAPQLAPPLGGVPCWEAFPEVNRALVTCLLGLLAGRMMTTPVALAGGGGGERDERSGQAG
jgi:hypothetical protein